MYQEVEEPKKRPSLSPEPKHCLDSGERLGLSILQLVLNLFLDELGLIEIRGAKKKASTSPKTWALPKSWEKPRLLIILRFARS